MYKLPVQEKISPGFNLHFHAVKQLLQGVERTEIWDKRLDLLPMTLLEDWVFLTP